MHYDGLALPVVVALVGVTILLVRGAIFQRARSVWPGLFGCSLCLGFWVGIAWGVATVVLIHRAWSWALLDGPTVAICAVLVDAVLLKLLGDPHA